MKIKRLLAGLLALLLICAVAVSCGKKQDETPPVPLTPETVKPIDEADRLDYTADAILAGKIELLCSSFVETVASPESEFWYRVENGCATLIGYLGESASVRVPDTLGGAPVTAIEADSFANSTCIELLYLPDTVISIGASALKGCSALKALRTPLLGASANSDQYLGYLFGAASYADNSLAVPATLEYLELASTARRLADYALFECNDLLCITLPQSMTEIGRYALYGCHSLITFNTAHLTKLDEHALDSCIALTRLDFTNSMTSFGLGALESCESLHRLTLPFIGGSRTENTYLAYLFGAETPEFARGFYPPKLTDVTLLEGAQALGSYAFFSCTSLTEVTLPEGLTEIGLRAFDGCGRLQAVTLPKSLEKIGMRAFYGCLSLSALTFDEGANLTEIGINAFYRCHALKSVTLPQSLAALPASCFADCISLSEINLGGVRTVGKNAFHRCQSLQTVRAVEGLTVEAGNPCLEAALHPADK